MGEQYLISSSISDLNGSLTQKAVFSMEVQSPHINNLHSFFLYHISFFMVLSINELEIRGVHFTASRAPFH